MSYANGLANRISERARKLAWVTVDREFEELHQGAGRNLIAFLDTELDLGFTFVRTAEIPLPAEAGFIQCCVQSAICCGWSTK